MWDKRLEYLFHLNYQRKASDLEKAELLDFLDRDEYQEQLKDMVESLIRNNSENDILQEEASSDILAAIFATTRSGDKEHKTTSDFHPELPSTPTSYNNLKYWLAAAAISGITMFGGYFWTTLQQESHLAEKVIQRDLPPGNDRAKLSMWNGTVIELGSGAQGEVPRNLGIQINAEEGELVSDKNAHSMGYNTLTTPLGGQYKVVLPDGSRAWLNAGSSIQYPTAFTGGKRSVMMSGEVYFEIHPDKSRPFTVRVPDKKVNGANMEVTVLGTHFSISSYPDEPSINTTLVEGAVEVKQGDVKKVLRPGQQARVSHSSDDSEITVKNVDAQGIIAWKEGRFEFNGNIKDIMRQIARWYDVQVKYEANADKKAFTGAISRKKNISDVLRMLELTGEVQFILDNGTVVVRPAH